MWLNKHANTFNSLINLICEDLSIKLHPKYLKNETLNESLFGTTYGLKSSASRLQRKREKCARNGKKRK